MDIVLNPKPAGRTWGGAIKPVVRAVTKWIAQNYLDAGFKLYAALKANDGPSWWP